MRVNQELAVDIIRTKQHQHRDEISLILEARGYIRSDCPSMIERRQSPSCCGGMLCRGYEARRGEVGESEGAESRGGSVTFLDCEPENYHECCKLQMTRVRECARGLVVTQAIGTVFIDAILGGLLRELGLPETLPLVKLSPRMQKWIVDEAEMLQRDAMAHPTVALLVEYDLPLTRENYLDLNNVDEDDLDAEQEGELPQLFQESMVEEWVASVLFEIEIDDTLRRLSDGAR